MVLGVLHPWARDDKSRPGTGVPRRLTFTGPAEPDQERMAPRMASRPSQRCCAVVGKDEAVAALALLRPAARYAVLVRTIVDLVLSRFLKWLVKLLFVVLSAVSGTRGRRSLTHNLPPRRGVRV